MGTTDSSWRYCGWNIDDIEVWGLENTLSDVPGGAGALRAILHPNVPNPFNPLTEIRFELAAAGHARVAIYDLQGRLVRGLVDEAVAAGSHNVSWDGKDNAGRGVGSGTYLCQLEAGGGKQMRKMLLVR
jgi:hypothetical protein